MHGPRLKFLGAMQNVNGKVSSGNTCKYITEIKYTLPSCIFTKFCIIYVHIVIGACTELNNIMMQFLLLSTCQYQIPLIFLAFNLLLN